MQQAERSLAGVFEHRRRWVFAVRKVAKCLVAAAHTAPAPQNNDDGNHDQHHPSRHGK